MAIKPIELGDYKLIIAFKGGEVSTYDSEVEAMDDINRRERAASDITHVFIGQEIGLLTQQCETLLCFTQENTRKVFKLDGTEKKTWESDL